MLAGGQSLIPLLAMRLAAPAHLVDINRIAALDNVTVSSAGVTVGALARHTRVEKDLRRPARNRCWPRRFASSPTRPSVTAARPSGRSRTPIPRVR